MNFTRYDWDDEIGRVWTHFLLYAHHSYSYLQTNYENDLKTRRKDFLQLKM